MVGADGARLVLAQRDSERLAVAIPPFQKEVEPSTDALVRELRTIIKDRPGVSFKVKIDSCFSAQFVSELQGLENLRAPETSSAANEVSHGPVSSAVA